MLRHGLIVGLSMLSALAGSAPAVLAQGYFPAVVVGYSAPLPGSLRGELTSSGLALGSASQGGPFLGVSLERGTLLGVRIEALYSRHSSPPLQYLGRYGKELLFAAEREETVGGMASLLTPIVTAPAGRLRGVVSAGVLRSRLRGFATIGGDAGTQVADSHTAPAIGAGLEMPVALGRRHLLLVVRGAQLVSDERGGGVMTAGVGLQWWAVRS